MPRSFMDTEAKWFPDGSLADLPTDAPMNHPRFPILWPRSRSETMP